MINRNKLRDVFNEFIKTEQSSGVILMICAVIALIISNSPIRFKWFHFWEIHLGIESIGLNKSLLHWVNDGLMPVFFLLVGIEIKREVIEGELSTIKKALLPLMAALGGMIVPAIIYTIFNYNTNSFSGWGIPMATDIAFALGVLALIGKRIPFALRILLTAIAVVDDLEAILVIALFYTKSISVEYLVYAIGKMYQL